MMHQLSSLRLASGCLAALLSGILAGAPRPAMAEAMAATLIPLQAGPGGMPSLVRAPEVEPSRAPGATFVVSYSGFSSAARAAFQRAVDIWARQVASPVPITVQASFTPLGTNILGAAGPSFVWRNFPGAPRANTWYVDTLANKRAGHQLNAGPDIVARFSSNFPNWYFGAGAAPANSYDFTTVVLHELGHGLGFLGAGRTSGSAGTVRLSGSPIIYDQFTENGAGTSLLTGFADGSAALGSQLRSNNLFFDSAQVRAANGGSTARLYAPATFQPGSSYSHLDEATYGRGNPNSLMTPILGRGETIRAPGPITLALFKTLGW